MYGLIVLKLVVNIHLISNLSWRTAPKLEMVKSQLLRRELSFTESW